MTDNGGSSAERPKPEQEKAKPKPREKSEEAAPRLIVSQPPHIKDTAQTSAIMYWVVIVLAPITLYSFYLFGFSVIVIVVMAVAGAAATEAFLQWILGKDLTLFDGSALLTGLLLALTLPPRLPFWIPFIGGVAAIGLSKFIFGGLGYNVFNPALVGRQVLLVSWAKFMTTGFADKIQVDTISGATPLYIYKQVQEGAVRFDFAPLVRQYLMANSHGSIGEASAILLLLGAAILFYKRIISWEVPVTYIGVVVAFSLVFRADPLFQVLSGGIILGAFFMATDYVTSPITSRGKLIFGAGCGFVNMLLRFYSGLPEATAYSILFMNALAPMIDKYTIPKPFGWVRERAAE